MSLDNKVVDLADLKVSHDYLLGRDELLSDRINELGSGIDGIQSQITALGNGSPIPVETVAEMTDNTKAYLYTGSEQGYTSGYWYTYDSTQAKFVPRGEYGAGVIIDSTLTVTGNAADAKATGDAIKAGKTFVVHVPGSAAVLSGSITAGDFAKALAAYTAGSGVYAVKDGEVYQLSAASSSTMTFTQMYHGTMNFIKQIQITSADTFTVTNTALSSSATDTSYSNTASGLTATNVQAAIDENAAALTEVNGRLTEQGYGKPYGLQPFQTSMFKGTENLFGGLFSYALSNGYYGRNSNMQAVVKVTPNWRGWLIRVKPDTTYATGPLDYLVDFFDETLTWDKRVSEISDSEPNIITTGSKSCWMALTQKTGRDMSEWMMVEGDTYPSEYVSGYPQWVSVPKVPDGEMAHTTIAFGYAPVTVTYNNGTADITLPNGQRAVLPNGTGPALSSATTLTANSAQFVSYDATADEWFLGAKRSGHETYVIGYVAPSAKFAHFNCAFKEVDEGEYTIAFMGDSITAGVAANGHAYHMYLHERYGWTCLNYGFGGAGFYKNSASQNSGRVGQGVPGIAPATTPENFFTPNNVPARLTELDSASIDGIVIFAGTNDWGNNISVADYISGIESAFDYCQTYFPTIPVLVMTPIHRKNDTVPNNVGKTLREYVDILIDECKKYSMPYVDTMTMTGIYPDNDANKAVFFTTDTSGLHPGSEGHKRIANAVGETLKSVLACNDF